MPNIPQTTYIIYAVNRIGAKLSIIHPLTPCEQLEQYKTLIKFLFILDISYRHFARLTDSYKVIVASIKDDLPSIKGLAYGLVMKDTSLVKKANVLLLKDMYKYQPTKSEYVRKDKETSVYLHSSGTTGKPKTIALSDYAINVVAHKSYYIMERDSFVDTSILTVLPMFHGFGLTLNSHNMLISGGTCALMPKFNDNEVNSLINKNLVNFIVGVPSLYEALLKNEVC